MIPLALQKQLLVAESELNRAQLVQEWAALADDAHALAHRAKTITFLASAAASVVGGLAFFRRNKSAGTAAKSSWLQTLLNGAQLAGLLWSKLRSPRRDQHGTD